MKIYNQRMTSSATGDVVVFLIGMRVNRWWKPWQWLRTASAMPRILRELGKHPEFGMLGSHAWFGRTTILVSYWKSLEHLLAYTKLRSAAHLPAWRAFFEYAGTNGDVGIWHETYRIHPGDYETVYLNMPAFGLGNATGIHEPLGKRVQAEGRLAAAREQPAEAEAEAAPAIVE
jgi:hypothetical protein